MEELKHAKGACWRCKILRKKVSYEASQAGCKFDNLANASSSATWISLAELVHAEVVKLHGS